MGKYKKTTKCHDTIITCSAETDVHEFLILTPQLISWDGTWGEQYVHTTQYTHKATTQYKRYALI